MFQPVGSSPPNQHSISTATDGNMAPQGRQLPRSKSAPAWLAFMNVDQPAVSSDEDFARMPELQQQLAALTAAYLQLRNVDKRTLFDALDRTVATALHGPLNKAETGGFVSACREIHGLEIQARQVADGYARVFRQLHVRMERGATAPCEIDWLAGGLKDLATPGAAQALERLIASEQMAKATQAAVYGDELERVFRLDLPDHEKVIVARAAQRFLNSATLVLNSPLGGAALANLQALQGLVGCGDWPVPEIPTGTQWSPDSVRLLLIGRLQDVVGHILGPGGKLGGLSLAATDALRQTCGNVLKIIDGQGAFNVPPSWMALAVR